MQTVERTYGCIRWKCLALSPGIGCGLCQRLFPELQRTIVLSCTEIKAVTDAINLGSKSVLLGARSSINGESEAFVEALQQGPDLKGGCKESGWRYALGGIGHMLPFLISNFTLAFTIAAAVVLVELGTISWIRHRYMETPWLSATVQVVIGGILVFLAGVVIGKS